MHPRVYFGGLNLLLRAFRRPPIAARFALATMAGLLCGMAVYAVIYVAGFAVAAGDFFVTLDADGEHDPSDIPRLLEPLLNDQADLVLGQRPRIARPSERLISCLVRLKVPVADSGTGFRTLRRSLALRLTFPGRCICGASVLEAHYLGARISEVPISLRSTAKPRTLAWGHLKQLVVVLRLLSRGR